MNNIHVIGNVGQDPVLRYAKSGMAVLKFSVADTFKKDNKETTMWHNVTVFDEMAENVAELVKKGSRVIVHGRLSSSQYTDKEGNEKTSYEIVASEVALSLRWKPKSEARNNTVIVDAELVEEDPF